MHGSGSTFVEFRLASPAVSFAVDVKLRPAAGRWVANATILGAQHIGIGPTPRAALLAALEPVGHSAITGFLADLGLLGPSLQVMALQSAAAG